MSETFECEIHPRLRDHNLAGHVDNVEALRIVDEGRLLFLRFADVNGRARDAQDRGVELAPRTGLLADMPEHVSELIGSLRVDYLAELRFAPYQPFVLRMWLDHVGRTSFTVSIEMRSARGAGAALVARSTMVLWNHTDGAPWPLSPQVRATMERYLGEPVAMRSSEVSEHYDLLILGAGSGNFIVNRRFAHLRVAIVEEDQFGGVCLNRGCIPSKMYVGSADLASAARRGPALGVRTTFDGADWRSIRDRIVTRIDDAAAQARQGRVETEGIDVLSGTARFVGERRVRIELAEGGEVDLTADQIVIATGSRPAVPDVPGLHEIEHHTSDTVMRIEELPARMAVLGGGYVGCELAFVFASLGVEVTHIHRGEALLSRYDPEVAEVVTAAARERADVRLGVTVEKVERSEEATVLLLSDGSQVETDLVLVAIGRVPNNELLEVASAGVAVDADSGLVVVDAHQRTTADGVWALGDASSPQPLKHVANQDARVIQHNLLADDDDLWVSDHRWIPAAVFTEPQVAFVGETEDEARERGVDVVAVRHDVADVAYGWALQSGPDDRDPSGPGGFVKLLADRATGLLVGAHLVGPMAATLIQPLIQAVSHDLPVAGLARSQYWIHPAPTEVVENALLKLERALR